MITLSDMLNINQPPEELKELYDNDYYWYLRSQEFSKMFLSRIGTIASMLGRLPRKVLDVGCGNGQLVPYIECGYEGFDGSATAIETAKDKYRNHSVGFKVGRFETPPEYGCSFETIIFGGILEVLIKPAYRVDFVKEYARRYAARYVIIYDLERLDTSMFSLYPNFNQIIEWHGSAQLDIIDAKRHRKILAYQVK